LKIDLHAQKLFPKITGLFIKRAMADWRRYTMTRQVKRSCSYIAERVSMAYDV